MNSRAEEWFLSFVVLVVVHGWMFGGLWLAVAGDDVCIKCTTSGGSWCMAYILWYIHHVVQGPCACDRPLLSQVQRNAKVGDLQMPSVDQQIF